MLSREREGNLRKPSPVGKDAGQPELAAEPESVPEPDPVLHSPSIALVDKGMLDDGWSQAVLDKYRPLDLGKQRVALLLRQLNAQLVVHGFVTSRARIKRADRQANVLEIELVPGRVESYSSEGKPVGESLLNAFPGKDKDILVLQDIEQGVQQIQRLRRYQAELRILPGQSPDASLVDIHLAEAKPWWFQFSGDNLGSRATGRNRARAVVSLENTLGFLESIGLTYLKSRESDATIASMAIPSGYNTWSASYAVSHFTQSLPADLQENGGSRTGTLAWNRVLHLSAAGRDAADVSLTRTNSQREIEGASLTPERLTVIRASISRLRQGDGWRAWGEFGLSRGVSWFGANDDSSTVDSADPHARFTKFEVHAGLSFKPKGDIGQYLGQIDAQTSRTGLYGSEQFRLGGMTTVRGYDEGAFSGDRGVLLRNEWHFSPKAIHALGGQVAPLGFIDHGVARVVNGSNTRLTGAGAGLRFSGKHWASDIFAARPLHHSSTIDAHGWQVHATFRIDL